MENKVAYEDTIDLMRLIWALKKKLWIIITVVLIFACGSGVYTKFCIQPTYKSVSTMLVLPKDNLKSVTSLTDLQLGDQISKDYIILMTSRPVLEDVIDNLELEMGYESLKGCINIVNEEDTRILTISVTMHDPKMAKEVVNELAKVSSKYIGDKMEVSPPKIIEKGRIPLHKDGPDMKKNIMKGMLVGMVFICGIIVVLELLNDAIRNEEDIERYLGVPVFAVVPDKGIKIKSKKKKHRKKRKA